MRKPDGMHTNSMPEYYDTWATLVAKFEESTGTHVSAFDPTLTGYDQEDMNAHFQVPVWLAQRVIKLKEKKRVSTTKRKRKA
jgi:hypothetical protein